MRLLTLGLVAALAACARSGSEASPRGMPVAHVPATGDAMPNASPTSGDAMPNAIITTRAAEPDHPYFEFQVSRQAEPLPGSAPPVYPPSLRNSGASGEVLLQFVVDTTGHVEPHGQKVLRSTNELFTVAVIQTLPTLRFRPAELEGRKVRQVVQQPFTFTASR